MLKNVTVLIQAVKKTLIILAAACSTNIYADFINYLDINLKNESDYNVQNISLLESHKGSLLTLMAASVGPKQASEIANFGMNFAGQLSQDLSLELYDNANSKIGVCKIHIGVGSFFARPDFTGSECKLEASHPSNYVQINPRYEIINDVYKVSYVVSKERNFSRIFVFGDSLSDNGNLYERSVALSLIFPISPILPISPPYYEGRFTNGKVWVETLSEKLNISPGSLLNYAFAGASVEKDILPVPNLTKQVNTYLNWNKTGDPYGLYIIWIGANDFVRHLKKTDNELIKGVLAGNESNLRKLILNGAKHILAPKLPDISLVPETYDKDAANGNNDYSLRIDNLIKNYNTAHDNLLNKLSKEFPDVNIMTFDVYNFMKNTKEHAHEYGFNYIKERCNLNTYYWSDELEVCEKPEEYVFFDGMHPSAKAHNILSDLILDMIIKNNYKPNRRVAAIKAMVDDVSIRNQTAIKSLHKDMSDFNHLGANPGGKFGIAGRNADGLKIIIDQKIPLY